MPSPASGAPATQSSQNGPHPQRATRRQAGPAPSAKTLAGILSQLSIDPPATSSGVSVQQLAEALRCIAALLEAGAGQAVADNSTYIKPALADFKVAGQLSLRAETLLTVLVAHRRRIERAEPDHAWMSRHAWFGMASMRSDRKDATTLIEELLRAGHIEERLQGEEDGWRQFRATIAGAEYAARLDPHGVFRGTSA